MDKYRLYMLHTYRSFYSCLLEFVLFVTQKLNYTLPDFLWGKKSAFKCIFISQYICKVSDNF